MPTQRQIREPVQSARWRTVTMQKEDRRGPVKTRKARFAFTWGMGGARGKQFVPGPSGVAHADALVHLLGCAGQASAAEPAQ